MRARSQGRSTGAIFGRFFDAPVGMIFTIHRKLETGSWLDYGMFLQNIMRLHAPAVWIPAPRPHGRSIIGSSDPPWACRTRRSSCAVWPWAMPIGTHR